ncbi:MAG: hypothetical protein COA68_07820 [Oceanobacter sp.]|nr:MAG: hypothetical protein COA68_07820 [Oceanobacter sp.]
MKYFKNINSYLGIKSVLILLASLVLTACGGGNSSTDSDNTTSTRQADLSFNVVAPRSSSAVEDIVSLQITVISENRQESQEVTLTADNPTVTLRLIPGSYEVTVTAFDASGQALSEGSVTLTDVVGGQRYSVSLTLEDILPELIAVIAADATNLTVDEVTGQYLLDITGLNAESSFSLPLSATASSGAISTYSWSILSGPSLAVGLQTSAELLDTVVEAGSQTATGDSVTLNYFRSAEVSGGEEDNIVVRLTLVDEGGNTTSSDLTVGLLYTDIPNVLPVAVAGDDISIDNPAFDPQQSQLPITVNLDGSASFDDDGLIAIYNWTLITEGISEGVSFYEGQTEGTYVVEVLPGFEGDLELQLEVEDNEGGFGTDTVLVSIIGPPNQAPTAAIFTEGPTTFGSLDGSTILEGFDSEDADGVILNFDWTLVNSDVLGSDVTIELYEGPEAIFVNWIEGFTGDIEVQLEVTDDDGATDTDTIIITVVAEPTAVISPAGQSINAFDQSFLLDGTGSSDAQGGLLTYSWSVSDPQNVTITDNLDGTATLTWGQVSFLTFDVFLTVTNENDLIGFTSESFTLEPPP